MAWVVTGHVTKRDTTFTGKGSSRNMSITFFDLPTAQRRAQTLILPDSRFSYVSLEETFDAKCPHCRGEMQEASA